MIPTIEQALIYLGLTLQDVHHYHGRDGALTVVTNDARKFRVSQADVEAGPPAIMPDLPTEPPPEPEHALPVLRVAHSQRIRKRATQK